MIRQLPLMFVLCSAVLGAGCAPTAVIEDLGTLGADSYGLGINSAGNVTGASYLSAEGHSSGLHAFRYVDGLGMLDLGALPGGDISEGHGINDGGKVSGGSFVAGFVPHAFLATATLDLVDLGTLGGEFSIAWDVNNRVQVTGEAGTAAPSFQTHAFIWTSEGGMHDLGTLGGTNSIGRSINERGQVAGESKTRNDNVVRAFRYTEGAGMVSLGSLGGLNSSGYGINDRGQVVGESETSLFAVRAAYAASRASHVGPAIFGGTHAFLWTEAVGMIDLGTLGGASSRALAINYDAAVVGYSLLSNGEYRAFRWTEAEGLIDLNTLLPASSGWVLFTAWDINDSGQIAGTGVHNGVVSAFRFNPPGLVTTPD